MMLRVEILSDYGDTCLIAAATPTLQYGKGLPQRIRPTVIVSKSDLVAPEDHQIVEATKSVDRSPDMASSPPSPHSPSRDLAASPEATPC